MGKVAQEDLGKIVFALEQGLTTRMNDIAASLRHDLHHETDLKENSLKRLKEEVEMCDRILAQEMARREGDNHALQAGLNKLQEKTRTFDDIVHLLLDAIEMHAHDVLIDDDLVSMGGLVQAKTLGVQQFPTQHVRPPITMQNGKSVHTVRTGKAVVNVPQSAVTLLPPPRSGELAQAVAALVPSAKQAVWPCDYATNVVANTVSNPGLEASEVYRGESAPVLAVPVSRTASRKVDIQHIEDRPPIPAACLC